MSEFLTVKVLSSMEKCFLDEHINDKKEKSSFVMFKNEKLAFQIAYYSEKIFEVEMNIFFYHNKIYLI